MKRKTNQFLIFTFLFITFSLNAQKLRFNHFQLDDGICQSFIYTINEDKNGYILFGTGEGVCRFDGHSFEKIGEHDTITHDVVSASFTDNLGNIWYGFNNSAISVWDGIKFQTIIKKDSKLGSIIGFAQLENGNILIASQRGDYLVFNGQELTKKEPKISNSIASCILLENNKLFTGSVDGLTIHKMDANGSILNSIKVEELDFISIQTIEPTRWDDIYLVGTENEGVYWISYKNEMVEVKKLCPDTPLSNANVQDLHFTSQNSLWVCTFNSKLINIQGLDSAGNYSAINTYSEKDGVVGDYLKTLYTDIEGNFWIGTYGNGFSVLKGKAFSFLSLEDYSDNNITAVTGDGAKVWFASKGTIVEYDKSANSFKKLSPKGNLPNDNIISMHYDNGIIWVGFNKSGLYKLNSADYKLERYFRKSNSLANSINYILTDEDNIYLATKNGIYILDKSSDEEFNFTTYDGISHNDIKCLYIDKEGQLLFATKSNSISGINILNELIKYVDITKYELEFSSLTMDCNNNLWVATSSGEGIFHLIADTLVNISTNDGLKSNYCYSIISSDSNYIWVGHRMGVSRISIYDYSVKVFDQNIGIDGNCNANAVFKDEHNLYFGTTNGVLDYHIDIGKKELPAPRANIQHVYVSDKEYNFNEPIELPYDIYKLRIDFVGLNYNNPDEVKYQYKLEGYDLDWSELTDIRQVNYPRVEDGSYVFKLRAYSNNGVTEDNPVTFSIKISAPIWKRWWFISIMVILLIAVVIMIIQYREHKQKQIQEYLEQRLDERTREVVEQKEEIEIKNRDITDSINYAQRIQTSILPPVKKLQTAFSGSFVFYQPRDIVSGDFYWFDKINDTKFIIVCADSTGHGVPGAFMSMIGTTLIKDICMRKDITSPSEILRELDFELRNTLNQDNQEVVDEKEQSNDGMDIIVCEIDINTCYLRYSSAMRPMIVYRSGEQVYLKGSRNSVGGHYDKDMKNFKDEGIQLSKGDLVYMFSDGYPDQFGGPLKKKFKMVRLKNLLKDINKKPMEEQYEYVKSTFNLWKEDLPQVDDVLFMGVKI